MKGSQVFCKTPSPMPVYIQRTLPAVFPALMEKGLKAGLAAVHGLPCLVEPAQSLYLLSSSICASSGAVQWLKTGSNRSCGVSPIVPAEPNKCHGDFMASRQVSAGCAERLVPMQCFHRISTCTASSSRELCTPKSAQCLWPPSGMPIASACATLWQLRTGPCN